MAEAPVALAVLVDGFRQAHARYEEAARLKVDTPSTFIPLFEALSWAASIDERHDYPTVPELRGLRYARNAVHHLWADALELTEGVLLPARMPTGMHEWRWRKTLPQPRQRKDEAAYFDNLAGRPARFTLGAVQGYLDGLP